MAAVASLSAEVALDRSTQAAWRADAKARPWPPRFALQDADEFVVTARVSLLCGDPDTTSLTLQAELPELGVSGDRVRVQCDDKGFQNGTDNAVVQLKVKAGKVDPWYPVGYGNQTLYTLLVTASSDGGAAICNASRRIGLREAKLVREGLPNGETGASFVFQVQDASLKNIRGGHPCALLFPDPHSVRPLPLPRT